MVILLVFIVSKSSSKECPTCPECKVCPTCPECKVCPTCPAPTSQCSPCDTDVNLDRLLYTLPTGTTRYPSMSNVRGITANRITCDIPDIKNVDTKQSIRAPQSGILVTNKDPATSSRFKYLYREYDAPLIATRSDPNFLDPKTFVLPEICPQLQTQTAYGSPVECDSNQLGVGVNCGIGRSCKLDGNDNDNFVCQ